ncbi:uncharacterized protein BDR25DRAFT_338103 [Lindgomyces ingoldianus]|uniref:Uncharacterized protein n=1 Tax=Lindgomyces ingoldianus TaxID=673940 RepID=A0ACB6Q9A2_9PLEO|nr:uncharacterized protein BDR25DRAFT_338103 [Lindgomyces ingoldianus]KAF2462942.1 hypothetical protein BDR25DRAFT_338103 [Lindgomyces ingoldianus]
MALIRLLQRRPDGTVILCEPTSGPDIEVNADRSKTTSKAGWRKIRFCADQAAADGLQYFWVDTCCIDKKNAVELGAAINSMFRWYQNAAQCYVYLSDVSKPEGADSERAIAEQGSWAKRRETTIEEDGAYYIIGICGVAMVLNYGEGRDHAFRQLEKEIHTLYKGINFEQYTFMAREKELLKMHKLLYSRSSRAAVLAVKYVRQHKEKYTAMFWLNANDEDSLRLSFRGIAQQVLQCHPSAGVLSSVDLEGDLD